MGKTQRGKSNNDTRQGPYDLCMPKKLDYQTTEDSSGNKRHFLYKIRKEEPAYKLLKKSQSLNQSEE